MIIKILDVAYGGESGFYQAIELSSEELSNIKFIQEKQIVDRFLTEVAMDSMKYAFGLTDVLKAMEMGASETVILWENLTLNRYVIQSDDDQNAVVFAVDQPNHGKIIESSLVTEWFAMNYRRFGTRLEYVTDRSQEGAQFCRGFGGVGALLRYPVDFLTLEGNNDPIIQ